MGHIYVQDKLWQTGEINLADPTHGFSAPLQVIETGKASFLTFGNKLNCPFFQLILDTVLNQDLVKNFKGL